jgi:toxin HigB-1
MLVAARPLTKPYQDKQACSSTAPRSPPNKAIQRLTFNTCRYALVLMIKNFKCKHTRALYEGKSPKQFRAFQEQAERKLQMLDSAAELLDLQSPPGNRLEKLGGGRQGQHSIRINKQWRICFVWSGEPRDVEITDYR